MEPLLVIYVTDKGKMVMLLFVYMNFVKWGENFSNFWYACMFKDVINFCEPTLDFF
jgi:hypothetical protein